MEIWNSILFAWNRFCKSGLVQFVLKGSGQVNMIYRFLRHGSKYSELKANPDTTIEVWHFVSLVIWFVVFWATFILDQTAEMFHEFYRSVAFPYWNILWLCIFSLTVYVANRYMDQMYRKRQNGVINVNIVSNVFLIVPVLMFMVFLGVNYSYNKTEIWNYIIGGVIIVVYSFVAGYLLFARFKIDRMEKKFVIILLYGCIVVNLIGVAYFSNISVESGEHKGSVQVLNILFLGLSSIRLILLFIGHHVNVVKGWMEEIVGFMFGTRNETDSTPRLGMNGREVFSLVILGSFFFLFYYSHPDHYRFYTLDEPSERAYLKDHFTAWMDSTNTLNGDSTSNIYLVSAQGGGSRGGYWTAKSLYYLGKEYPRFDQNLFAISSVSGGTVGAAVYLGTRNNYERVDSVYGSNIDNFFGVDYVSNSFFDLLYTDQVGKVFNYSDRNTQLQEDMEISYDSAFVKDDPSVQSYNRPFPLIKDNGQVETALFANSFNITEKKKAIVSSLEMEDVERFGHDDILKNTKKNLSLPQAVNLSEMFPILSGSAKIRYCANENLRRFYDGGVYENYGISTIADIYETIVDLRNDGHNRKRKIVVILLLNSKSTEPVDYRGNNRWDGSIKSMLGALSNSTFVSWPERERQRLNYLLNENFDTLYTIEVDSSYTLNRWISNSNMAEMDKKISARVDTINIRPGREVANRLGDALEIYFNSNSSTLSFLARKQLSNYYNEVIVPSSKSGKKILISGFADFSVSPNYYDDLLRKRIFVIWSYLISRDEKIDQRIEDKRWQLSHQSTEKDKKASNRIVRIELVDE